MISGRRPLSVYNCNALINGGKQRVERNAYGHPEAHQLALLLEDPLVFVFNDQVAFISPRDERLTYRSTILSKGIPPSILSNKGRRINTPGVCYQRIPRSTVEGSTYVESGPLS